MEDQLLEVCLREREREIERERERGELKRNSKRDQKMFQDDE